MQEDTGKTLDIRHINMDNMTYVTEAKLLHYASTFKGGTHRANTNFEKHCVVIGYGTRTFTHENLKAVDDRLQEKIKKGMTPPWPTKEE